MSTVSHHDSINNDDDDNKNNNNNNSAESNTTEHQSINATENGNGVDNEELLTNEKTGATAVTDNWNNNNISSNATHERGFCDRSVTGEFQLAVLNVEGKQQPLFRRHRRCESATVSGCGGGGGGENQRRESATKLTHRRTKSNITTTTFNCHHRNSSVVVVITKEAEKAKKCSELILGHCKVYGHFLYFSCKLLRFFKVCKREYLLLVWPY